MERDKLIILKPGFLDPAYPGQTFYCWHCALMEGLLSCYPEMASKLDVQRISWPKPRQELIDLVGPENQSVPILILADDAPAGLETGSYEGLRFVDEKDAILRVLSERYGIADPHP